MYRINGRYYGLIKLADDLPPGDVPNPVPNTGGQPGAQAVPSPAAPYAAGAAPAKKPGFFSRVKTRIANFIPQGIRTRYGNISNWMSARGIKPVPTLLGAGLTALFAGKDLAEGRSIGAVAGENLGFWGGMAGVNALAKKLPNFRGKGAITAIGGMIAGMPASHVLSKTMDKYTPIGRLAKPVEEDYYQ